MTMNEQTQPRPAAWRKTAYTGTNAKKHLKMAAEPALYASRMTNNLYRAVEDTGLEHEREKLYDAGDRPLWFNVTAQVYGKDAVIFLYDYCKPYMTYNWNARQRKIQYCRDHDLPALEVWPGPSDYMRAQIELWLATFRSRPQKFCEGRRPKLKLTKKDMGRK
jgi:hypothetical protein